MSGLSALVYLDACRIRNTALTIARKPARLLPWAFFVAWFGFSALTSHLRMHSGPAQQLADIHEPLSTLVGGIIFVILGLSVLLTATSSRLVGARDPADAYFLARSAIPEPIVFLWLQIRAAVLALASTIVMLAVLAFTFSNHNAFTLYAAFAGLALLFNFVCIPAFFASRGNKPVVVAAGLAIGLFGLALITAAGNALIAPSQAHEAVLFLVPVGRYVHQLATADATVLIILYGASVACIAVGVACSRDMYPDIYASARQIASTLERIRGRRFAAPVSHRRSRSGTHTALRGPYAEIWKQLAFMRRANGPLIIAIGIVLPILVGGAAGFAMLSDQAIGIAILTSVLVLLVMFLAMGATSLATDIAKPLWWFGDGTTFEKLLGWTIGSAIPFGSVVGLMMLSAAIIGRSPPIAIVGLMAAPGLPFALRGIGVFAYSLIPSGADQRGPGMALRLLLLYVAFIPAVAGAIGAAVVFPNVPEAAFLAIVIVFIAEGALGLYFASGRIQGRGVEFALAENQ